MIKQDISENRVNIVYLALGSNLGNRIKNIEKAKLLLIKNNISLISVSKYYETASWPNPKNPKFINIVLKAKCLLNPNQLLNLCKSIEVKLGRKKTLKNSPRECDIDIIDFNSLILKGKLNLPHKLSEVIKQEDLDLEKLSKMALDDPSTSTNPKKMSIDHMKILYEHSMSGKLF